jgi:hypothetical protein
MRKTTNDGSETMVATYAVNLAPIAEQGCNIGAVPRQSVADIAVAGSTMNDLLEKPTQTGATFALLLFLSRLTKTAR